MSTHRRQIWLLALFPTAMCRASTVDSFANGVSRSTPQLLRRLEAEQQKDVRDFHLWPSKEIYHVLQEWKKLYPDFVKISSSQEKYGLPAAGTKNDCTFDTETEGCPNYIMEIQDYTTHPEGSLSSNQLAEVFWSGCLHGNERVGPTAVMEATTLLLEAASCEALPKSANDLSQALQCRQGLRDKGVNDVQRQWLARLVTTRRIVALPTSNALGYFQNERTENGVDPNRDFPYDLKRSHTDLCMQTIAGRTLNEIYREHMFQLALTFHAGMEVVAYEWGAPTWLNHFSPDHTAQTEIGAAYSKFGGGWASSKVYEYGTMNDEVYYVRGGMEDWAYAGSWDPERVLPCTPKQYGGYPKSKTEYNNSTLRVFNMLVETSDNKEPPANDLGNSLEVLNKDTAGNGHVSRNIRLALMAADMVEPYVSIIGVNQLALTDDLVPGSDRAGGSCFTEKAVMVAQNSRQIEIQFTVGGAISIDNTDVWFAKWNDVPEGQLHCLSQPTNLVGFTRGTIVGETTGSGVFSEAGSHPRPTDPSSHAMGATDGPVFVAQLTLPDGLVHLDQLVVVASARVDQGWTKQVENTSPELPPQSHVVNARTDPTWHHESAEKIIQGRLDWYSSPLIIMIGDFSDTSDVVTTREFHPRFGKHDSSGARPSRSQLTFPLSFWHLLAVGVLVVVFCFFCVARRAGTKKRGMKGVSGEVYVDNDDGFVFEPKPYSDDNPEEFLDEDGVELPNRAV